MTKRILTSEFTTVKSEIELKLQEMICRRNQSQPLAREGAVVKPDDVEIDKVLDYNLRAGRLVIGW